MIKRFVKRFMKDTRAVVLFFLLLVFVLLGYAIIVDPVHIGKSEQLNGQVYQIELKYNL